MNSHPSHRPAAGTFGHAARRRSATIPTHLGTPDFAHSPTAKRDDPRPGPAKDQVIGATYVGDLMAAAGVTHTIGREAESTHGENMAGVRRGDTQPRVHYTQGDEGTVQNEGVIWRVPPRPYGISYRSITPRRGECENLFVPICLSASHVAHGSIRMEPVFTALSQSAAIAAGMAIDLQSSVQDVPYPALRDELETAKQLVRPEMWKRPPAAEKKKVANPSSRSTNAFAKSATPGTRPGGGSFF